MGRPEGRSERSVWQRSLVLESAPERVRDALPRGLARATGGAAASKRWSVGTTRLVEGPSASMLDSWCGQLTELDPTSGSRSHQLTSAGRSGVALRRSPAPSIGMRRCPTAQQEKGMEAVRLAISVPANAEEIAARGCRYEGTRSFRQSGVVIFFTSEVGSFSRPHRRYE